MTEGDRAYTKGLSQGLHQGLGPSLGRCVGDSGVDSNPALRLTIRKRQTANKEQYKHLKNMKNETLIIVKSKNETLSTDDRSLRP